MGEEVRVAQEEAIIVWDAASKTEHFIRRASFTSSAERFGFLVPTPSIPELGEVDSDAFQHLAHQIRPQTRTQYEGVDYEFGCALMTYTMLDAARVGAPDAAAVRVVAIASVAGYDASVLQASDTGALAKWLGEHGFAATPELEAWLDPYVRNGWTITAFEIAATPGKGDAPRSASSASVRMSFTTNRPFYPYREPAAQQAPATGKLEGAAPASRLLRVFFLGDARVDALLGAAPWSAEMVWAAPIESVPRELAALAGERRRLTVFQDEAYPRRGVDEVWFDAAVDQAEVRPPEIVTVKARTRFVPVELLGLVVLGGLVVWGRRQRRRRAG